MKTPYKILILVAVCALIGAQIRYSTTRSGGKAEAETNAVRETSETLPETRTTTRPNAGAVTTVIISGADGAKPVWLERTDNGWNIETLYSVPANAKSVGNFLNALLGEPDRVDNPADTGTDPDEGVLVSLGENGGEAKPYMILGLSPEGSYDSAYARMLDTDEVVLVHGDVRGDMGLWKNETGLLPRNEPWLETRVLAFDPDRASSFIADYPDNRLEFSLTESGEWEYRGVMPGGVWKSPEFLRWLADVADFRIAEVGDPANREAYGLNAPTHTLEIRMDDGAVKTIAAAPDRMDDGMWVESSDLPEHLFYLPGWRFRHYFQRVNELFPLACPRYSASAIRFIDIRRGGESVKLARHNNEWRAVATRYPLRPDRVIRLASVLSSWRPDDFAAPGVHRARPAFGGPLVEVTLENGTVVQYRLGGRHPVFPWRYVLVDGKTVLSTPDANALSMFPDFAEIMDLGMVFDGLSPEQATRLELSSTEDDEPLVSAGLTAAGEWEAVTGTGRIAMEPDEVDGLVFAPFSWNVAGFHHIDANDKSDTMLLLEISGGGTERRIVVLSPDGRDIPYVDENDQTFLLDRTAFFTWLGTLRGINGRIEKEAEKRREEETEQSRQTLEEAEAEAVEQALAEDGRDNAEEEADPAGKESIEPDAASVEGIEDVVSP